MAAPLTHDDVIEDMARRLGTLYAGVNLSRDPMFSWLHITNDMTILGEELRRDRENEAVDRACKILIRLLEFLGYYLYCHPGNKDELSDLVASTLREPSFDGLLAGMPEGPSRWILVKFPYACAKCGQQPCHCMVYPLVFENRRGDPEGYLQTFKSKADAARKKLAEGDHAPFTLKSLLSHFRAIYHNSYCHQDLWRIGMHLSEEIGEATTELSRINLRWRAEKASFDINGALAKTFEISGAKLGGETELIKNEEVKQKRAAEIATELATLRKKFEANPWAAYGQLVGEKFKEEVSDVFSWLAAIIDRLDPKLECVNKLLETLSRFDMGAMRVLACKYCHQESCANACLVTHGVSAEITEKLSKF